MSEKTLDFSPLLSWRVWVAPTALSIVLIAISHYNYLLFHTLAELFTITVGVLMFVVALYTHSFSRENFLLYLGAGYIWVQVIFGSPC